jgi:hypothetical protein
VRKYILFLLLSNLEPSGPKNITVGWVITAFPYEKTQAMPSRLKQGMQNKKLRS